MILDQQKEEILSNFGGEELSYSIDATTSHVFEILRKNQYNNGKKSLVRELMMNGKDAHVEAGKSAVPIKVWLNEKYLTIQDFGIGMSLDRVKNVYLHYGRSTKNKTNDLQGGFGIGAKSYFSYASSAQITTIHQGVKREFISYLNETNVGAMKPVSEEPAAEGESDGTSVKIPIQSHHFTEFRNYVRDYAQFMEPIPIILGDNVYGTLQPPKVLMEGTGWKLYEDSAINTKYNILLDGIPYNYDIGYNRGCDNITFIFPTGTLQPSSTRETLVKCEKNDHLINEAIKVFKAEIQKNIEDKIANCDDFVEVIKAIQSSKKFFQLHAKQWKWLGGTLEYPYEDKSILRCRKDYGALRKYTTKQFEDVTLNSFILVPEDFNYCDVKGYTSRRINYYKKDKGLNTVYIVKPSHGVPDKLTVKLEDIKIPSYNAGIKTPKAKNTPKTSIYVKYRGKTSRTLVDIDRTDKVNLIYTNDVTAFYNQYNGTGHILICCVEVQEKDLKLIKGKPGWYTIQEYIEEKLTRSLTKEEIELEYKKHEAATAYGFYLYLKDYLHEDFKVAFEKTSLTNEQISLIKFIQINGELDKPEIPDLFTRYPLLKVVEKSEVDKIPGVNNYHFNIKIELKDVIQYVELINKETNNV